ncbi:Glucosaminyl phosphatidylinositol (GlcN-PI) nositol acylation protein [Lecanora helva]
MAQSYKTLKENFVSNLSGGRVAEINFVTAVAPSAYLVWSVLQSRHGYFDSFGPAILFTDFLLNVVAILLATTLYSSIPILLNVLLLSSAAAAYVLPVSTGYRKRLVKPSPAKSTDGKKEEGRVRDYLPVRPFVTAYRGSMMIITCLSILAVDFRIFPRRFAKAENWGTSLMDMGVGSFVFSAGLISARPVLQARLTGKRSSFSNLLLASLRSSLPLLVLGIVRLYSVKGLDYAEHVTEYGVHWNFFFTLAFLPPFAALFQTLSPGNYSTILLSLACAGIYEVTLNCTNLKAYMLTAQRTDLLSQNREGVFSFAGYLAIFFAGQAIGYVIFDRIKGMPPQEQRRRLLFGLSISSAIWSTFFFLSTSYNYGLGIRVSRRLANLPYVLWVAAFNSSQITIYSLIETICFPAVHLATNEAAERKEVARTSSRIVNAYNRNGLAIFLLANLMTGLVNLTMDTLTTGSMQALAVLVGYAGSLTAVAVALDYFNLSIKL